MLILRDSEYGVRSLAFSPDGATLYAGQGSVRAWNLANRTSTALECGGHPVYIPFALHPGGRWAFGRVAHATPPRYIQSRMMDLAAGTLQLFNFAGHFDGGQFAFDPAGAHFVAVGHSQYEEERPAESPRYRLYWWAVTDTGPEYAWHRDVPTDGYVSSVAWLDPDRFATAETVPASGPRSRPWQVRVALRRSSDGEPMATFSYPHPRLQQLLGSPDGSRLVGRLGTELRVWAVPSSKPEGVANNRKKLPSVVAGKHKTTMDTPAAAFHPSGRYLLMANDGPSVLVFDTATWKEVRKWKWSVGVLRVVAVSPDGSLAAAAGPRGNIVVWDLDL